LALFAACGYAATVVFTWGVRLQFDNWVERMATPPNAVAMLRALLAGAPAEVRALLQVEEDDSFTLQGALIKAIKPAV